MWAVTSVLVAISDILAAAISIVCATAVSHSQTTFFPTSTQKKEEKTIWSHETSTLLC